MNIISAVLVILIIVLFISCYYSCLYTFGLLESEDHVDFPWKRLLVIIFSMVLFGLITSLSTIIFLMLALFIVSSLIWIFLLIIYLSGGYLFGYFPFAFLLAVCFHSCILFIFFI